MPNLSFAPWRLQEDRAHTHHFPCPPHQPPTNSRPTFWPWMPAPSTICRWTAGNTAVASESPGRYLCNGIMVCHARTGLTLCATAVLTIPTWQAWPSWWRCPCVYAYTSQVSEATRMRELETANEDIWLKVTVYNSPTPLLLCATYRPPTSSATGCTAFCSHIEHSIRVAKSLKGHILIAGDMHIWTRSAQIGIEQTLLMLAERASTQYLTQCHITSPNLSLSPHTLCINGTHSPMAMKFRFLQYCSALV